MNNKHIAKVTDHTVSYTPEFKKFAVIENRDKSRRPQDIFITEGIAISLVGDDTPQRNVEAWRNKVKKQGIDVLDTDNRGRTKGSGERRKKERLDESKMNDRELIEYYKTKSVYLDAENDFLARTRGIPRMATFVYRPGSDTAS